MGNIQNLRIDTFSVSEYTFGLNWPEEDMMPLSAPGKLVNESQAFIIMTCHHYDTHGNITQKEL